MQIRLSPGALSALNSLGPIGDETLIARPLGLLRMVNAASPAYLARYGVPRSLEDLQRQEHRTIHFSTMLGARPIGWEYPDGDSYATLQLPGALHVNSAQTYEAAALAGLVRLGATLGDWPILREWSTCGNHTRFSSPGARRVPRRGTSEQSVAPSPRIHEMDRRCADAVSGIARTSSSGLDNQHSELCLWAAAALWGVSFCQTTVCKSDPRWPLGDTTVMLGRGLDGVFVEELCDCFADRLGLVAVYGVVLPGTTPLIISRWRENSL